MKDWGKKVVHFMDLDFNPNQYIEGGNVLYFTMNNHKEIALKLLTKDIDLYSYSNVYVNDKNEVEPKYYSARCCFYALDDLDYLNAFIEAGIDLDKVFKKKERIAPSLLLISTTCPVPFVPEPIGNTDARSPGWRICCTILSGCIGI